MDDLLAYIKSNFDLRDDLRVVSEVQKGVLSKNYILANRQQKYFLKRYRFEDSEQVAQVHRVKKFFSQGGVPVILPMIGKDGTFFSFEGGVYALFPFVDAIQISRRDLEVVHFKSMAKMLAKIHRLGSELPFGADGEIETWDTAEFIHKAENIRESILSKSESDDFDRIALRGLELKLRFVEKSIPDHTNFDLNPSHQIHGDFHDGNVFFDGNNNVSHVFDFEKTGVRHRIYEVIRSMDYMCVEGVPTEKDMGNIEAFMTTYQSEYPLSQSEIEMGWQVYFYKKIQSLWIESEHYLKQNCRPDIFIKPHVDSLEYFAENFDDLTSYFGGFAK